MEERKVDSVSPVNKKSNRTILIIALVSFVSGILGGGFFDRVLLPFVEATFKDNKMVNISDKTEKITVEENSATIDVAKNVSPSVVTIIGKRNVLDFFGDVQEEEGSGTGFVLTSDGMILTNKHVVADEDASYTVITSEGKDYKAKVLSRDPSYDLAVLKIEAQDLKVVDLGDSDDLEVGQRVVAIGNALGEFQNSVTAGVISGKGRPIVASDGLGGEGETLEGLLQTDAAINPGNSGGPLLDLTGKVIGINTAVAEAENIGFAIPINIAKPAIDSAIKTGKIIRPMIGVRYVAVTKDIASLYDLPVNKGAMLYSSSYSSPAVVSGSPADKAGLREDDIITKIGDYDIDETQSLSSVIQNYEPGDKIDIIYYREGKEQKTSLVISKVTG